jgi:hypothetical protein
MFSRWTLSAIRVAEAGREPTDIVSRLNALQVSPARKQLLPARLTQCTGNSHHGVTNVRLFAEAS